MMLFGGQALDAAGHQVGDPEDLLLVELGGGTQLEHHRGRGLLLVLAEQALLGDHDVHPGLVHILDRLDRAGELALQGPAVVDLLHEVGDPDVDLVEDLVTDPIPAGQALAGQGQPGLGDLGGGNQDHRPVLLQLVGDLVRLELHHDVIGVILLEPGVEHLVLGALGPDQQRDHPGHSQQAQAHHRHPLLRSGLVPDIAGLGQELLEEFVHPGLSLEGVSRRRRPPWFTPSSV